MERVGNQGCSMLCLSWTSQEQSHLCVPPRKPTTDTTPRCGKTQPSPFSMPVPGVIPAGC